MKNDGGDGEERGGATQAAHIWLEAVFVGFMCGVNEHTCKTNVDCARSLSARPNSDVDQNT